MSQFIDLSTLVENTRFETVIELEKQLPFVTKSKIRNTELTFITQSKRQLWQAVGLEHIEPELLDYLDSLPKGSVYYDIGASSGVFALYAAALGLCVWAFEPEAQNYALLEYNNYLNSKQGDWKLNSLNIALTDKHDLGTMFIAKYEAAGHMKILNKAVKVQSNDEFSPAHCQKIMTYDLDSIIDKLRLPHPEHIKIDVDGSELELLRGAEKTLKNHKLQSVFIELDETSLSTPAIQKILLESDFQLSKKFQVQNYNDLYNYIYIRK